MSTNLEYFEQKKKNWEMFIGILNKTTFLDIIDLFSAEISPAFQQGKIIS